MTYLMIIDGWFPIVSHYVLFNGIDERKMLCTSYEMHIYREANSIKDDSVSVTILTRQIRRDSHFTEIVNIGFIFRISSRLANFLARQFSIQLSSCLDGFLITMASCDCFIFSILSFSRRKYTIFFRYLQI